MSFIIGDWTAPDPNEFNDSIDLGGEYNKTLKGGIRRSIRYKKQVWKLGWSLLSASDFALLKSEYDKNTTILFVNTDLGINATVHMDRDDRNFVPGTGTNYLTSISIILREV